MTDHLRDFDELVQRYIEGTLDDEGAAELLEILQANPELSDQMIRDMRMESLLRSEVPHVEEEVGRRLAVEARRSAVRLQPVTSLETGHFWQVRRIAAVAAMLLVAVGLLALWLVPSPTDRPLTQQEKRRQQVILEQLDELRLERAALRLPRPVPKPGQKTERPKPEAPTRAQTERSGREETEEAVRFIEARQRFVAQQLRMFRGQRPLPTDLDVEQSGPTPPTEPEEAAVVVAEPVGRVLETEGGADAGVLIRQTKEGPSRIELAKGLMLLRGDRIETADIKDVPCTSVQLKGGATLDLDRGTSIEVLGRDNLYLCGGRIYSNIAVPYPEDSYPESGPPFSVQTEAGRFLTYDLQAEVYLSPHEMLQKELRARVDHGKAHLVNHKGHVVGRKGQELKALKGARPNRREGFSKPIWRGRERNIKGFPFGRSSPVIFSATSSEFISTHYVGALALRGEINLSGVQLLPGEQTEPGPTFDQLVRGAQRLRQFGPQRFPLPVLGAQQPLNMPSTHKFVDTLPLQTPAVRQILAGLDDVTPAHPMVVICSGAMTDVACAWLMDRRTADRVVVIAAPHPSRGIKWQVDPWSAEIVLRHVRCVLVKGQALFMDRAQPERITDPRWRSLVHPDLKKGPRFRLVHFFSDPTVATERKRMKFIGFLNDEPKFKANRRGNILYVIGPDEDALLKEFERVFLTAPSR